MDIKKLLSKWKGKKYGPNTKQQKYQSSISKNHQ